MRVVLLHPHEARKFESLNFVVWFTKIDSFPSPSPSNNVTTIINFSPSTSISQILNRTRKWDGPDWQPRGGSDGARWQIGSLHLAGVQNASGKWAYLII